MFLVNYTMGEDPYDHTKIGDYSRKVFREETQAQFTYNEWLQGCLRQLERERVSWFSIQVISLTTGEMIANRTMSRPQLERKRLNVKPTNSSKPLNVFSTPVESWAVVDQQPDYT